jgi:hypothetical protein
MTEFDVFLSHNSKDKPAVRELARRLSERNIASSAESVGDLRLR